jgi:hypothetical protein
MYVSEKFDMILLNIMKIGRRWGKNSKAYVTEKQIN